MATITHENVLGRTITKFVSDALTTGDSAEFVLDGKARIVTAYFTWSAGVSAGVGRLHTAPVAGYTGTWAQFGPASTFSADSTEIVQMSAEGVQVVKAVTETNVVGGTLTVTIIASE